MEQAEIAAVDDEPGRTDVSLDDVFRFRAGIFQTGGRMLDDGFGENFIQVGSFDFLMTSSVDLGGKLEELRNIMAGFGAGDENGGVGEEIEILLEFIEDFISIVDEVGLSQDDDNSLAGFDDLAGESLVELRMVFRGVDEKGADVGFFNGGESANGGEFFDANFTFARFTQAGSVEDLESTAVEFYLDAIDVAGSSLARADEGLLFLAEGVE